MQIKYGKIEVVILGDGVMANVTKHALSNLDLSFKTLSRKENKDFNQLNLVKYFINLSALPIVINTCAREFMFNGIIPKAALFWDFNYNFEQHLTSIPDKVFKYVDGLEMLELQALYAVTFWST